VNGTVVTGTTSTLTIVLGSDGTYSWGIISIPSGYTVSPTGGNFKEEGSAVGIQVTFTVVHLTSATSTSWTYLGTLAWILIGTLVLASALLVSLAVLRTQRRRPPAQSSSIK
jgi:hypothetical protein